MYPRLMYYSNSTDRPGDIRLFGWKDLHRDLTTGYIDFGDELWSISVHEESKATCQ